MFFFFKGVKITHCNSNFLYVHYHMPQSEQRMVLSIVGIQFCWTPTLNDLERWKNINLCSSVVFNEDIERSLYIFESCFSIRTHIFSELYSMYFQIGWYVGDNLLLHAFSIDVKITLVSSLFIITKNKLFFWLSIYSPFWFYS